MALVDFGQVFETSAMATQGRIRGRFNIEDDVEVYEFTLGVLAGLGAP